MTDDDLLIYYSNGNSSIVPVLWHVTTKFVHTERPAIFIPIHFNLFYIMWTVYPTHEQDDVQI